MKSPPIILLSVLLFIVGVGTGLLIPQFDSLHPGEWEQPRTTSFLTDQVSPYDHVKESSIRVYDDRVELLFPGRQVSWARYEDSKSMDPILDSTANGIEIIPRSPTDIHEGDIIAYRQQETNNLIVHRVMNIGFDEQGWYAITRGDNNPLPDPERVRFSDVQHILVAIVY